jgi:hypothetical protein
MVVNKGEEIIPTLQLIKSDWTSFETEATVTYKIIDSTGTVEVVPSRSALYNSNTGSYTDTVTPSADWVSQEVGSYLISWSVSDTEDNFPTISTETLEISIDKTKVDRILGLVHENMFIDQTVFDAVDNLKGARLRIYENSNNVGTNNGVLATYRMNSDPDGPGRFVTWRQEKE